MFCSLPDLYRPKLLGFGQDFVQPEFNPFPITIKSDPQTNFHPLPLGSTFSSQGLLHDPNIDVFLEPLDVSQLDNEVQFPFGLQFYEPMGRCSSHDVVRENVENPESFFNEFPADILDQIELLPSSPENWFFSPFISVKCWELWFASLSVNVNWCLQLNVFLFSFELVKWKVFGFLPCFFCVATSFKHISNHWIYYIFQFCECVRASHLNKINITFVFFATCHKMRSAKSIIVQILSPPTPNHELDRYTHTSWIVWGITYYLPFSCLRCHKLLVKLCEAFHTSYSMWGKWCRYLVEVPNEA